MLANVAGPLDKDFGARAVDRFFINWTVYPDNDGVSPGHMHHIHALYVHAPPVSILWLAVRALAYADLKYETVSGTPFNIKAREYYGAALHQLRVYASEQQRLVNDQVLAAVLLIDNFEVGTRLAFIQTTYRRLTVVDLAVIPFTKRSSLASSRCYQVHTTYWE